MFDEYSPLAAGHALDRAWQVYSETETWGALQRSGMEKDFSWDRSAREYAAIYELAVRDRAA
jgi:starch synthase